MSIDLFSDFQADRFLLDISSKLAEPICQISKMGYRLITPMTPHQFDNFTNKIAEVAYRAFAAFIIFISLVLLPGVIALGVGSKIFKAAGYACQKDGYTHIWGKMGDGKLTPEQPMVDGKTKTLTINVLGVAGGMSLDHGGGRDWRDRIDGIIKKINVEKPDTIVFQEIYDGALGERIVKELGSQYAHFFTHLGASTWGSEGGCMVATKHAYSHFSNTNFSTSQWTTMRSFGLIELKAKPEDPEASLRIVGTHLEFGSQANKLNTRESQIAEIVHTVAVRTLKLPTFLAGDLNIERDSEEDKKILLPHFEHSYLGIEPTCTNTLIHQWDPSINLPEEIIDYFSRLKQASYLKNDFKVTDCHLVDTYTPGETATALSDHRGVSTTIELETA